MVLCLLIYLDNWSSSAYLKIQQFNRKWAKIDNFHPWNSQCSTPMILWDFEYVIRYTYLKYIQVVSFLLQLVVGLTVYWLDYIDSQCGSSSAVAPGYAGSMRRLKLVATDNIPIFDAPSAHRWISCCAEAAPVAPDRSLSFSVTRT